MNNSTRNITFLPSHGLFQGLLLLFVLMSMTSTLVAQNGGIAQKELDRISAVAVSYYQNLSNQQTPPSLNEAAAVDSRILNGQEPSNYFGTSIASAGDVNGDGYDDVIVGAYGYSSNTGRAYIYYGGPSMDDLPDVVLTGESAGVCFGWSVSGAGDVNGDGYADVIVGAYGYSSNRGRAYIYYGGLHMDMNPDLTFTGEASGAYYGFSVSTAGDINGDGYADVIVGAYGQGSNQGRAYVYLGGSNMNTIADITMNGETFSNNFGYSVSRAGDVNGDGYDDFIIGAPQNASGKGRAYIYYGGPGLNSNMDVILSGEASGNIFGISVSAAGDVNGDGFADVIVGAYGYSSNTGRAYIYYGGAPMNTVADITLNGETANSRFGMSVSDAGDVNGDGYGDVIVGAYGYSGGTGKAYVYFGGSGMNRGPDITTTGEAANSDFGICVSGGGDVNGDGYADVLVGSRGYATNTGRAYVFKNALKGADIADVRMTGESQGGAFGYSVSTAGDVNGDGYADVIVGLNQHDRAYIYFGGPKMDDTADVILSGEGSGDFGKAVSTAGDVNGDGYADVIVGAFFYSPGGRAYIYFGGPTMKNAPDVTLTDESPATGFGRSVAAAGDVNGDGYGDVIVGTSEDPGHAFVYFGGPLMDSKPDVVLAGSPNGRFGSAVSGAGDVNRDGYSDVIVAERGHAYIFFGGSSMNSKADVTLGDGSLSGNEGSVSGAGDVNGDGYDDVVVGSYESALGSVFIYYGGSPMDNIPDVTLSADEIAVYFGFTVSGAGDVNADGYSDVMTSAMGHSSGLGKVYIYFGSANMDNIPDVTMMGEEPFLRFGISLSGAGDVNGDGYADVIVGADQYGLSIGRAFVYRSSSPPIIPRIAAVTDVPHDQGGVVNVRWIRSAYDARGISQVTSYRLERSNPPGNTGFSWAPVATIDAGHNPQYSYSAPTPSDSMSGTGGHFYFRVTALTANKEVYWRSNIVSGYSVDNLSPNGVTGGKIYASVGERTTLQWDRNRTDSDLFGYVIYRDTTRGIPLEMATRIAITADTAYVDSTITKGKVYYYRVAAIDIHGNIGAPSAELSLGATEIRDVEGRVPAKFALEQNYPNPFNPSTVIPFALPKSGMVSLKIYNFLGQVVATLIDGHKEAGFHQVRWRSSVPSGIYFYRLQAGEFVETKKMILLR